MAAFGIKVLGRMHAPSSSQCQYHSVMRPGEYLQGEHATEASNILGVESTATRALGNKNVSMDECNAPAPARQSQQQLRSSCTADVAVIRTQHCLKHIDAA